MYGRCLIDGKIWSSLGSVPEIRCPSVCLSRYLLYFMNCNSWRVIFFTDCVGRYFYRRNYNKLYNLNHVEILCYVILCCVFYNKQINAFSFTALSITHTIFVMFIRNTRSLSPTRTWLIFCIDISYRKRNPCLFRIRRVGDGRMKAYIILPT